jgi:flagellar basal-body rod protein FlgG
MNRSLLTAASGMNAQQMQVDALANNIANSNTTGFKRSNLEFRSLFYQTLRQPGAPTGGGQQDGGLQVGSGVDIAGSRVVLMQGNITQTGNNFDVAIEGNGFFEVTLPNGESRFTRDGSFRRDATGALTTSEGFYLQPQITLPDGVTEISIGNSGEVSYVDASDTLTTVGDLQLTRFPNPFGLRAEGGNLYAETVASGTPTTATPGENGTGFLVHQALEGSNVSTVEELVGLIVAQRSYEMNSRAVQVSDEMLQTSTQLVR